MGLDTGRQAVWPCLILGLLTHISFEPAGVNGLNDTTEVER